MTEWVKTSANNIPNGSIRGGYDKNGHTLFIARALTDDGFYSAGKASLHYEDGAHIPYRGQEIIVYEYEILVLPSQADGFYDWKPTASANVPSNAVPSDINRDPQIFVGRFVHEGCLIPGKVDKKKMKCYIAHNGKEYPNDHYEVLVKVK